MKLSVFGDDLILYKEIPMKSKNTIRTNKWIQQSCRIQDQCDIIFMHINNKLSKNKIKKTTQFTGTSIRIKCFGTNLTLDLRLTC